jgi:hypothetical protein
MVELSGRAVAYHAPGSGLILSTAKERKKKKTQQKKMLIFAELR